jgi:hypothetical protein
MRLILVTFGKLANVLEVTIVMAVTLGRPRILAQLDMIQLSPPSEIDSDFTNVTMLPYLDNHIPESVDSKDIDYNL